MNRFFTLRLPSAKDGASVHRLVALCPPLDQNSLYCNLLQASHFAETSILAEHDGEVGGFISGYRVPQRDNVLFIWQVAVSPQARGQGLALSMLESLLARLPDIDYLETTVTPDNTPSARLFSRLASNKGVKIEKSVLFDKQAHFEGGHEDEELYRIGPFTTKGV